jgi:hypothetical protein
MLKYIKMIFFYFLKIIFEINALKRFTKQKKIKFLKNTGWPTFPYAFKVDIQPDKYFSTMFRWYLVLHHVFLKKFEFFKINFLYYFDMLILKNKFLKLIKILFLKNKYSKKQSKQQ